MGEAVIAGHEMVEKISYVLPNKHYIPVNMDYLGIANMTEYVNHQISYGFSFAIDNLCRFRDVAEVFMPVSAPRWVIGQCHSHVSLVTHAESYAAEESQQP